MNKIYKTFLCVITLCVSGTLWADTINLAGEIDGTEPTFDQPLSTATDLVGYQVFSFSVDTDGMYSFLSFYPGDTATDENLDGVLLAYADGFDPLDAAAAIAADDDYTAGDVAALSAFDAACTGSNCSGFEVMLSAGTTYFLVQSTFTNAPTSFGQATGPFETVITGPGNISAIPIPAAFVLLASSLLGLGALRKRG